MKAFAGIGIAVACLFLLAGLGWYFLYSISTPVERGSFSTQGTSTGAHSIVLTRDGFRPSELTINVGDTVVFSTNTNELFWPASNLHPSHLIYPEFDPNEPVSPDQEWSFTFTKEGEWKFHDHLAPYFTGVIIVE